MPNVEVRFTGVNAYVFDGKGLTVVAPNATRLGRSPQSKRSIPAHMLTIWQTGQAPEHYLWKGIEIKAYRSGNELAAFDQSNFDPILAQGNLLQIPKSAVGGTFNPDLVSGRVHLSAGFVQDEKGPCKELAWSGNPEPASVDALVNRLVVSVKNVDEIQVITTDLLKGGVTTGPKITVPFSGITLFAGNVCSDDVLMRPCNDKVAKALADGTVEPVPDHDFEWMYALTDPALLDGASAPVVPHVGLSACGFKDTDSYEQVQSLADTMFEKGGGGGLCGCQCVGCVAQPDGP